jgi:hypothetical protein
MLMRGSKKCAKRYQRSTAEKMTALYHERGIAEISICEGVRYDVVVYQENEGPALVAARLYLTEDDQGFGVAMQADKAESLAAALHEAVKEARRVEGQRK